MLKCDPNALVAALKRLDISSRRIRLVGSFSYSTSPLQAIVPKRQRAGALRDAGARLPRIEENALASWSAPAPCRLDVWTAEPFGSYLNI